MTQIHANLISVVSNILTKYFIIAVQWAKSSATMVIHLK